MSLFYAFRESALGFRRSGSISLVSAGALVVSMLMLGAFVLLTANLRGLLRSVRERLEIAVYLEDGVAESQALKMAREIGRMPGIERATYVDKATAAREFRMAFGGGLLEAVSHNPLPASIRAHLDPEADPTRTLETFSRAVRGWVGVEDIDTGLDWIARLNRLTTLAYAVNGILGLVISLSCAFAISNTIQLSVVARSEAIEVMRLVGATERFIRLPFLITGIAQGALGGVAAAALLTPLYAYGVHLFPELPVRSALSTGIGLILFGAFLGALASLSALRRVLRTLAWR